jgi:Mg-chelatase subunit ChlD
MTFRSLRSLMVAPLLLAGAWTASSSGCQATAANNGFGGAAPSSATGEGGKTSAGGGHAGGSTGAGGDVTFDAGASEAGLTDATACTSTSAAAELIPLDLLILLDRSGSMDDQVKWPGATGAIKSFVNDPASKGVNVGIVYFPVDVQGDDCNEKLYEKPVVDVAALPGNAKAITDSIDATSAQGNDTPTWGALNGALHFATALQDAHPDHKVIVVFATDGDPTACTDAQQDPSTIAELPKSALDYNGVETYVIAMAGATIDNLNKWAAAGGTGQAYDVSQNIQAFSQKMADIRKAALACQFNIPAPPKGQKLDPERVNVKYAPGDGSTPVTIPQSKNLADCGNAPGWYYDNGAQPTKILLCPSTCAIVQKDAKATLDVMFGCKTEIN